jgi:hypothetical protein
MSVVLKEGAFAIHGLLQHVSSPVTGTGMVRLVQDVDGTLRLRVSELRLNNPRAIALRFMAFRVGPKGAERKPKGNYVDVFGEPLWLDAGSNGACTTVTAIAQFVKLSLLLCTACNLLSHGLQ